MFGKMGKRELSPMEKKAKMSVLDDLRKEAQGMMKSGLDKAKGLKKVTVASDSPEGLKEGLEKAEDMLGEQSEEDSVDPMVDQAEDEMEMGDESIEDLKRKIQELQAKLEMKK